MTSDRGLGYYRLPLLDHRLLIQKGHCSWPIVHGWRIIRGLVVGHWSVHSDPTFAFSIGHHLHWQKWFFFCFSLPSIKLHIDSWPVFHRKMFEFEECIFKYVAEVSVWSLPGISPLAFSRNYTHVCLVIIDLTLPVLQGNHLQTNHCVIKIKIPEWEYTDLSDKSSADRRLRRGYF